jgi:V/A-type H+-transporting ATPase subunit E
MAGIDNIKNEILQEAQTKAEGLKAEARKKADDILDAARKECEKTLAQAQKDADKECARIGERTESSIQMQQRSAVLTTRQAIIDEVIAKAKSQLKNAGSADYFNVIYKLLEKNVQKADGTVCLSQKDLKRLPADFAKKAAAIAEKKGGKLTVSGKAADIADGFVLQYSGIDENCTFDALFAEKQELLRDKIREILW